MNLLILVRKYEKSDEILLNNLIKKFVMSNAKSAVISCIFREITLQSMILLSAIFFIFLGIPLVFCIISVPIVLISIVVCVYSNYFTKAMELISEPYQDCWVAEVYEPYFMTASRVDMDYARIDIKDLNQFPEINKLRKNLIGTISIKPHQSLYKMGWLYRNAVDIDYSLPKVTKIMLNDVINYCKEQNYYGTETSTIECHEEAREMYLKNGFTMRQVYHKYFIGGFFKVMKVQLGYHFDDQIVNENNENIIDGSMKNLRNIGISS